MRDLSAAYKTSASGDARNYTILLHVLKKTVDDNGNVSFPENTKVIYSSGDSLISVSIVDGQTSGNSFQLGQTFCPIISFTTVPNLNIKTGDKVQVELVFTSSVRAILATGYVDEYSYDSIDYAVSYTAYGKMLQLDKDYNSALTYPATFSAVVGEICSQNGLAFDAFTWKCNAKLKSKPIFGNLDNGEPAYASAREMLGIIAGVNGCNVIIGADEKVKFVPYTDTKTDITYEDAFSRQVNNEKYVIKKAVLNDGGQTTGDEAGYVELYFPLETVEGKASCLEKLNSVITGLSVMGMTVQMQGKGYYEIGDMLSYTDFDGEKYTIGVMGIKYDFGGGYFTETLYSLAPSEMEEQYKGNVRYSSASTTIKNPVVISENTSSYLGYQYHTIGYRKGDKITYGQDGSNIIVQGYEIKPQSSGADALGSIVAGFAVYNGIYNSKSAHNAVKFSFLNAYTQVSYITSTALPGGGERVIYRFNQWFEYVTLDGETHKENLNGVTYETYYGNFSLAAKWEEIYAPTDDFPYGRARLNIGINFCNRKANDTEKLIWWGGSTQRIDVSFSSIEEYNAAVQLSGEPLELYDVTQDVMKIGEADEPNGLPTTGDVDTLYITYQPPACWKYSTITNKYYCVGRNYRELQRIKSSTEESNALEVFNVPVIFDCRTKTEWDLEANAVYPKGFMIFEQNPENREVTKLKIANGIDKLSDLQYTNAVKSDIPTKTSQLENDSGFLTEETDPTVPAWAKAESKPTYTADEVGAAAKKHTHNVSDITDMPEWAKSENKPIYTASEVGAATAADITAAVNAISIGGRNIVTGTADVVIGYGGHSKGHWRKYGTAGTIQTVDITNTPISCVSKGIRLTSTDESSQIICGQDDIPLNSGMIYTFSCWIRSNSAEGVPCRLQPFYKSTTDHSGNTQDIIISDEWQYISFTAKFSPQSTGTYSGARIYLQPTAVGNYIEVCAMKLEAGNKPTDWSPAPEDTERRIISLEARVAALEAAAVSGGE